MSEAAPTNERSGRYHLDPRHSQRLFNLLSKKRTAKDRAESKAEKVANDRPAPPIPNQDWQHSLAQALANAGFDPAEAQGQQYANPYAAWRFNPTARNWAQQADVGQLEQLAAGQAGLGSELGRYIDLGGDINQDKAPLRRFLENAVAPGADTFSPEGRRRGYEQMKARLVDQFAQQGYPIAQATMMAHQQLPNQEVFDRMLASQAATQGWSSGALGTAAPFFTLASRGVPILGAAMMAPGIMSSPMFQGWMGDADQQRLAEQMLRSKQLALQQEGGPSLFGDIWRSVGSPASSILMGDAAGGSLQAATGLSGLASGGAIGNELAREQLERRVREGARGFERANQQVTRTGTGGLDWEGAQALMNQQAGLKGVGGTARDMQIAHERTNPYVNLWEGEGIGAYLTGDRSKALSEYESLRHDANDFLSTTALTHPIEYLKTRAQRIGDWARGTDQSAARMKHWADNVSWGDENRAIQSRALQERALKGKWGDDAPFQDLSNVTWGQQGQETAFYDPRRLFGVRRTGQVEGASVDSYVNSPAVQAWRNRVAQGQASPAEIQQMQANLQRLEAQQPEAAQRMRQQLAPAMQQWKQNHTFATANVMGQDFMKRQAQQPASTFQAPSAAQIRSGPVGAPVPNYQKQAGEGGGYVSPIDMGVRNAPGITAGSPGYIAPHRFQYQAPQRGPAPNLPAGSYSEALHRKPWERYGLGDPAQEAGQRRNLAFQLYHNAPNTEAIYGREFQERWQNPRDWYGLTGWAMTENDKRNLDPGIRRLREQAQQGNWSAGMRVDPLIDRNSWGWTNPLGPVGRFFGLSDSEESQKAKLVASAKTSPYWQQMMQSYREGLISPEQLAQAAPARLGLMGVSPEDEAAAQKARMLQIISAQHEQKRMQDILSRERAPTQMLLAGQG